MLSYLLTLSLHSISRPSPAQHDNTDNPFDNQGKTSSIALYVAVCVYGADVEIAISNSRDYPLTQALFQAIYSKGYLAALHSRPAPSNHFSTFFTTFIQIHIRPSHHVCLNSRPRRRCRCPSQCLSPSYHDHDLSSLERFCRYRLYF